VFSTFSSASGSSRSTGQRYHCSARITWPAPWTWSWDRRSSSGPCLLRSWETARSACTAPTATGPSHTVRAGIAPAPATTTTTTTTVRRPLSAEQHRSCRRQSPSTLHVQGVQDVWNYGCIRTPCIHGNDIAVKRLNYTYCVMYIVHTYMMSSHVRFTKHNIYSSIYCKMLFYDTNHVFVYIAWVNYKYIKIH